MCLPSPISLSYPDKFIDSIIHDFSNESEPTKPFEIIYLGKRHSNSFKFHQEFLKQSKYYRVLYDGLLFLKYR